MSGILRLESLTKGNILKQGDLTLLKYRLFDADGDKLDISGKPATVRLMKNDFTFIAYEKEGLTVASDDTISFSINKILPAGLYHLEVIVDDKYIFPSRDDEGKFNIDKSILGAYVTIVETVGVEAVARKATSMMKQDEEFIDDMIENVISDTNVGNIEEYYNQFNEATTEFGSLKTQAINSVTKSDKAIADSASAKLIAQGIDAKATNALILSESADTLSKSVQEQFNQVVIDGDSSVESAQARVTADGVTKATLKERLDDEHTEVTAQLEQIMPVINVKAHGLKGDGTDDAQSLKNLVATMESGTLHFPKGRYKITSEIVIEKPNIHLDFSEDAIVNYVGFGTFIRFKGSEGLAVSVIGNLLEGSDFIEVDDTDSLQRGDWIQIMTSELVVGGRAYDTKREFHRIKDINGTTITLDTPLSFSYESSYSPTIRKQFFLRNVGVSGLNFDGETNNLLFAIVLDRCMLGSVTGCNISNAGHTSIEVNNSILTNVSNNYCLIDYADSLQYGIVVRASSHVVVDGNRINSKRTAIDITAVSQFVTVTNNVTYDGGINTHSCKNVIISSNTSHGSGFLIRGSSVQVIGNLVNTSGSTIDSEEGAEGGIILISDNVFRGRFSMRIASSDFIFKGNIIEATDYLEHNDTSSMIRIGSKARKNIKILNNTIRYVGSKPQPKTIINAWEMQEFENLTIDGNTIEGGETGVHMASRFIKNRTGLSISNNYIKSMYIGIRFSRFDVVRVCNNNIVGLTKMDTGILGYSEEPQHTTFVNGNYIENSIKSIRLYWGGTGMFNSLIATQNVASDCDEPMYFNRYDTKSIIGPNIDNAIV